MTLLISTLSLTLKLLSPSNKFLLSIGRQISWILVAIMVLAIVVQIFFRYVLNDALAWPEELARVMMIWMMALMAPSAYRQGGFVAIKMFADLLPYRIGRLLNLFLMILSSFVLGLLLYYAWKHFNSGFIFKSSTLKIPLAYIYFSMSVCLTLMLSVNLELIIRNLGQLANGGEQFEDPVAEG